MKPVWDFVWGILGTSAVALAILAVIGTIFQKAITTWMTKRVAAGLERDADRYRHDLSVVLEAHKSQLNRDIEGYKSELSRAQDVQRIKAEVRRSVGERLIERRLAAIDGLTQVLNHVPSAVAIASRSAFTPAKQAAVDEKLKSMDASMDAHSQYCNHAIRGDYMELSYQIYGLASKWEEGIDPADRDKRIEEITGLRFKLDADFQQMLVGLPDEIATLVSR